VNTGLGIRRTVLAIRSYLLNLALAVHDGVTPLSAISPGQIAAFLARLIIGSPTQHETPITE
jgi:hypothetical protein